MKRKRTEKLSSILSRFCCEAGIQTPLNQHRAMELWPEVVGERIAPLCSNLFIDNQTLCVHVDSPIVKSELAMRKGELVQMLNAKVGTHIIADIRFV